MAKFEVGDFVIGNERANSIYITTVEGWKGEVIEIRDNYFTAKDINSRERIYAFIL